MNKDSEQGCYQVYLFNRVPKGRSANYTPFQAVFNTDTCEFDYIPDGWYAEFFNTFDDDEYDYYATKAVYDPATKKLGEWMATYKVSPGGV